MRQLKLYSKLCLIAHLTSM